MKKPHKLLGLAIILVACFASQNLVAQGVHELWRTGGAIIDLKDNSGDDYDVRLHQVGTTLRVSSGHFTVYNGDLGTRQNLHFQSKVSGQDEWYFHTSEAAAAQDYLLFGNRAGTSGGWSWVAGMRQNKYFWAKGLAISSAWNNSELPTGYMLAVDGKIMAEEVTVQLSQNWPDYVFAADYNLLSLAETETYINEHKHLPGLPSAAEVAQDGIDLAEMNALLLEKIEELTLHTIQLQKEVDALKNTK